MLRMIIIALIVVLAGCEATAVKNADAIRTKKRLDKSLSLPVQIPVAFYVDSSKPDKGVNFYGKLEEASALVAGDMFSSAEKLSTTSDFQYLLRLKTISNWDRVWGGWLSKLDMEVVDRQGESLYSASLSKKSSGGGPYDYNAVHNALAKALKELLIEFMNSQGKDKLAEAERSYREKNTPHISLKELFKDMAPRSTGTGFFINTSGDIATAAHVVDECLYVEVMHKGKPLTGEVQHSSALLDLAVISTDFNNSHHALISRNDSMTKLGKQVFVTGFPLSGILADYPSLTVGNVSSMGGLKGAKGHFQFSAPVQPGNSGGAIVDYRGNLVGVVSSSLNQAMLLRETGTTSQNVNFGTDLSLLKKFFDKHQVRYRSAASAANFEKASADAVEYTTQVLCYK